MADNVVAAVTLPDKWQAIQSFWASFDIPAYDENSVTIDMQMPYITYEARTDSLDYKVSASASIWYRSPSWATVSQKADAISEAIDTRNPIRLKDGFLWITRGTPYAQRMADETDENVRRIYLNVMYEFLTAH